MTKIERVLTIIFPKTIRTIYVKGVKEGKRVTEDRMLDKMLFGRTWYDEQ